jgi:hypothetical protein
VSISYAGGVHTPTVQLLCTFVFISHLVGGILLQTGCVVVWCGKVFSAQQSALNTDETRTVDKVMSIVFRGRYQLFLQTLFSQLNRNDIFEYWWPRKRHSELHELANNAIEVLSTVERLFLNTEFCFSPLTWNNYILQDNLIV